MRKEVDGKVYDEEKEASCDRPFGRESVDEGRSSEGGENSCAVKAAERGHS